MWDSVQNLEQLDLWFNIAAIALALLAAIAGACAFVTGKRFERLANLAAVVLALLAALAAALAFGVGKKLETQAATRAEQAAQRYVEELNRVKNQLDGAEGAASEASRELAAEKQRRIEAEARRRTAPQVSARLELSNEGKFKVVFSSGNLVAFECQYFVVTKDNVIVSGIPLDWVKVFPNRRRRLFLDSTDIQRDRVQDRYLELHFEYKSLAADELNLPGHRGTIVRKYRIGDDQRSLIPIG
jgi:type II secretory pathway pseudopilin PulG